MDLLILGSLLLTGGLLSLAGAFDGSDDKDDSPTDDAHRGTEGDDTLNGDSGIFQGLGGDDQITVSGTAEGRGDQGNDTLTAEDNSTAYGGAGEDELTADGFSTLYGGGGADVLISFAANGGSSENNLYGGGGDDTLMGSPDGGVLDGGVGNDLVVITHGTTDGNGVDVDVSEGNDILYLDPHAVFSSPDAGGHSPIVVQGFGPGDRLIFGTEGAADTAGLNWVQGEDCSFTLYHVGADNNIATNLTVFTTNGLEPGYEAEFGSQTLSSTRWLPLDDLRDASVTSTVPVDLDIVGTNGADVIDGSGPDSWRFGETHGLDGNDTITTGVEVGDAYGGNGDDQMYGSYTNLHGDAGNDTLTGYDPLYGGAGDDVLHLERFGGERDDLTGAYGGEGNDTIIADHASDGRGEIFGGEGDDFISMANGNTLDAGSGDDTVMLDLTSIAIAEYTSAAIIKLGAGADLMSVNVDGPVSEDFTDSAQVVDFNAAEGDALCIVIAAANQSSIAVTVTQDPGGAYTDVTISHDDSLVTQTLRLQGAADVDLSHIQLYENDAAVAAGTPYGHL